MQLVTERLVTLTAAGGLAPALRCWAAPESEAFKNLSIFVSSMGLVLPAGNLDWAVYYGGNWDGTPFLTTSTHSGGVIPTSGSGSIAGSAEVYSKVWTDAGPFAANRPVQVPSGSGWIYKNLDNTPIVLLLTNAKAAAITVKVIFAAETVTDWR